MVFCMEFINIGPVYIGREVDGRGAVLGWVVVKAKKKKQDDTKGRV